jgi:hypothetical protein
MVPPNLDLNRHRTSPLAAVCPPALLDALIGWAGLLDTDAKWYAISHSWDEFFGRTQRAEWRREALLGKTLFELFPDDDQRQMFRNLLTSISEGKLEQHVQVVEFGSGAKALHLLLHIRPLWEEGALIGYIAQGIDVTREHMNRIALLDRDRRMRDLQTVIDEQKQRLETVISRSREREDRFAVLQEQVEQKNTDQMETLAQRTLEHSQEVNAMQEAWEKQTTELMQQITELRAECERLQSNPQIQPAEPPMVNTNGVMRSITAELAEEYSNLLTGVLGHSSLAAAELGDSHAAVEDVRAIERAARTAAKLTRKLSALSGSSKRGNVELKSCLQSYFRRHNMDSQLTAPEDSCEVRVDAAALDVILDAIISISPSGLWSIECDDSSARLTILTEAPLSATAQDDLLLAREVAHAHGGELIAQDGEIVLSLPLVKETTTA